MSCLHGLSRLKIVGPDIDLGEDKETSARMKNLADCFSIAALGRIWKTALTGVEDIRKAPDPFAAAEMTIIRLMAAASLPSPEDAAKILSQGPGNQSNPLPNNGPAPRSSPSHTPSAKINDPKNETFSQNLILF